MQIAELLFVKEVRFEFDQARLGFGGFGDEFLGELGAAASVEGEFESGDAAETPVGIGDRLNELGFADADGLEFADATLDVLFVGGGIVGGKQDGAASEGGFQGVDRGLGFAFGGAGAGRERGISPVGGEAGGGDFDGLVYGDVVLDGSCFNDSDFTFAGELFGFAFLGAANGAGSHDEGG